MKPERTCRCVREALTSYLAGELPPEEADAARRHLETCRPCRASAEDLAATLDLLRDALAGGVPAAETLDPHRLERIRGTPRRPAAILWIGDHAALLARVASLLAIVGIASTLVLPTLLAPRAGRVRRSPPPAAFEFGKDTETIYPSSPPAAGREGRREAGAAETRVTVVSGDATGAPREADDYKVDALLASRKSQNHRGREHELEMSGKRDDAALDVAKTPPADVSVGAGEKPTAEISTLGLATGRSGFGRPSATAAPVAPVGTAAADASAPVPVMEGLYAGRSKSGRGPAGGAPESAARPTSISMTAPAEPQGFYGLGLGEGGVGGAVATRRGGAMKEPETTQLAATSESLRRGNDNGGLGDGGHGTARLNSKGRLAEAPAGRESGGAHQEATETDMPLADAEPAPKPAMTRGLLAGRSSSERADPSAVALAPVAEPPSPPGEPVITMRGLQWREEKQGGGTGSTTAPDTPAKSTDSLGVFAGGIRTTPQTAFRSDKKAAIRGDGRDSASGSYEAGQREEILSEPVFEPAGVNPFVETATNAFSTFAIDVDTASYAIARRYIADRRRPPPESVRTEEFINAFDYDDPPPASGVFAIHAEAAPSPFRPSLHILKIGVKARRVGRDQGRAAALTLVVDTSGSMNTPDRLDRIRSSLRKLVENLDPHDTVSLVAFNEQARLVLDSTAAGERDRILAAIDGLSASGSTHLEAGVRLGYETAARGFRAGASNRVLLFSDGAANLGAAEAGAILQAVETYRRQGVYASVFGFGIGTYNDVMLERLADKGDGQYVFIDSDAEAERVLVGELAATLHTVARDAKIQVEFDPRRVSRFRQVGYENRRLAREQFRDDAVDAGEVGSGQAVTALYEIALHEARRVSLAPPLPLATVRVRYRDVETGRIEEIEQAVTELDVRAAFDDAPPRFRLAAGVAEFAEMLRGSPYAAGTDPQEALDVLRPVAAALPLDGHVAELVRLVQASVGWLQGR